VIVPGSGISYVYSVPEQQLITSCECLERDRERRSISNDGRALLFGIHPAYSMHNVCVLHGHTSAEVLS